MQVETVGVIVRPREAGSINRSQMLSCGNRILLPTACRPVVGIPQPHILWVPQGPSPRPEPSVSEVLHPSPYSTQVKCTCSYTATPLQDLNGMALN
jgi:hypothetical protein